MKANIIFHDNSEQTVTGKDLRIHMDGPGSYHITDAYHNHRMLAAFAGVREATLSGKPKKRKPKEGLLETLKVEIDTTKLQACIKEAMLELEGLADKEQYIHKEDIDDDYLDKNISREMLAEYGVTTARIERDQLQVEVDQLRATIAELAFVPHDVATAANLLEAELLVFLDNSKTYRFEESDIVADIHYANGIRFAIGKLTGTHPVFDTAPAKPTAPVEDSPQQPLADLPSVIKCTCPPKREVLRRGHLSSCPAHEGKADCEPQAFEE